MSSKAKTETPATTVRKTVQISAPNFCQARFEIRGNAPLVLNRFSAKTKNQMLEKMIAGKSAGSKKVREPMDTDVKFNDARYISPQGWDGFNAASIRLAMIRACSLVGFKMVLAKMSIFVIADGWDEKERQIPLVRIHGTPVKQEDMARVETGQPYVAIRPAYHDWKAFVQIRWDQDQFSLEDVTNLLARVGGQVGIGEGRPSSKNSCGMGWGTFDVAGAEETLPGRALTAGA